VYDEVRRYFHVINSITVALTRQYVCRGCNKVCRLGLTHKCEETCSDCKSSPPCMYTEDRVPCESCNRNFRSRSGFEKHKTNKLEGKTVCEKVRNCPACNMFVTRNNHECFKRFCANCNKNMEINHLCYMQPLKCPAPKTYYSYPMISRPRRARKLARRQNYTTRSSFAFSNSVRPARCKMTMSRIAHDAVRGSIRFSKTP